MQVKQHQQIVEINVTNDTKQWNEVCLKFAEKPLRSSDIASMVLPAPLDYLGYAINILPATQQWNKACLDFSNCSHQ